MKGIIRAGCNLSTGGGDGNQAACSNEILELRIDSYLGHLSSHPQEFLCLKHTAALILPFELLIWKKKQSVVCTVKHHMGLTGKFFFFFALEPIARQCSTSATVKWKSCCHFFRLYSCCCCLHCPLSLSRSPSRRRKCRYCTKKGPVLERERAFPQHPCCCCCLRKQAASIKHMWWSWGWHVVWS